MNKPVPGSKKITGEYHNLKLTQNLSTGQMGYHITNAVVLVGDTTYALDNPAMDATAEHRHVDQLMEKIH